MTTLFWRAVGASVIGQGHIAEGLPCQDAHAYAIQDHCVVAVVADGAGSAAQSHVGAQHICDYLTQVLLPVMQVKLPAGTFQDAMQLAVVEALSAGRVELADMAAKHGQPMSAYHATVVGFVSDDQQAMFFHIGDGFAAAPVRSTDADHQTRGSVVDDSDYTWHPCDVSRPANGQWANETFFFTQDDWRDNLRFHALDEVPEIVFLMSDGAAAFAAKADQTGLDIRFAKPVHQFLAGSTDPEAAAQALAGTLDAEATHAITSDDKTLLWLGRAPSTAA